MGGTEAFGNSALDDVEVPFGLGKWDEPLGIPLCVVCQNANGIEGGDGDGDGSFVDGASEWGDSGRESTLRDG